MVPARVAFTLRLLSRGPSRPERVACGERVLRAESTQRSTLRVAELGRAAPLLVRLSTKKLTMDLPAMPRAGVR